MATEGTRLDVHKKDTGEVHIHHVGNPDEVLHVGRSARDCRTIAAFLQHLRTQPISRRMKKYLLACLINDVDA